MFIASKHVSFQSNDRGARTGKTAEKIFIRSRPVVDDRTETL